MKVKSLIELKPNESGTVVQIQSGHGLVNRLNALGIRPGRRITKISAMLMRGPVTIQVNRTQVAIGFGIAKKIMVELDEIAR